MLSNKQNCTTFTRNSQAPTNGGSGLCVAELENRFLDFVTQQPWNPAASRFVDRAVVAKEAQGGRANG